VIDDMKIFLNTEMGLAIEIPYKIIFMHAKENMNSPLKLVSFTTKEKHMPEQKCLFSCFMHDMTLYYLVFYLNNLLISASA